TMQEITRAADLQSFQHKLKEVPDDCLAFHISQNHISKWLNARALFQIAELLKPFQLNDFRDVDDVRNFIFDTIALFRITKRRGIIAEFNSKTFDEYFFFSRIGKGSMGGKARGLAFIDSLIKRNRIFDKFEDTIITIPRTVVIATDIFDEFMRINDLYEIGFSDLSDEEILSHFIKAKLPEEINNDLNAYISVTKSPVAIRSSSLLEDSLFQPFAGIYSTYMIPYEEDNMLKPLSVAIKSVYASVFFKNSKAYLAATSHRIEEEKMAVVLQEICGNKYDNKFYPTISGVARSINFYPIHPEKAEEGIANIAIGLGKYIVNGELSLRFSPKHPKNIIQLADPKIALKETQKRFYALNMDLKKFKPSVDECINILRLDIDEAVNNGSVDQVVSTYDFRNNVIRDGINYEGKKIITFSNILNYNIFPLADIISTLLDIGQREMNNPVEIEFAVNLDVPEGNPKIFNFLQIRPIVEREEVAEFRIDEVPKEKSIILSDLALGNGIIDDVKDMIYVKPDSYDPLKNKEIPLKIEKINNELIKQNRKYVLAGPGRWGSADPYLGIPVKWSQISAVKVIVESGLENYRIEPSQGTHFFQNITSFRIGYFTINPYINDGFFDIEYLSKLRAVYEDEYIRHIRFEKPLNIIIDGKNSKGVILKG
ncbi:MAG: phosphoenolpyruvate synthase, partial [Bacteroidales bacterium]|nr:phosphoenolpyruvate synthase [Bacteroidales bacterium]